MNFYYDIQALWIIGASNFVCIWILLFFTVRIEMNRRKLAMRIRKLEEYILEDASDTYPPADEKAEGEKVIIWQ